MLDLSELPKKKWGGKDVINWVETLNCKVKFQYGDVSGELLIKNTLKNPKGRTNRDCLIEYMNEEYVINTAELRRIEISNTILRESYKKPEKFRFAIGEVVNGLVVKERRVLKIGFRSRKKYRVECQRCGQQSEKEEYVLKYTGCPVCSNKKIIEGINDVTTTHPWIIDLAPNPTKEQIKKYSYGNNSKKFDFVCPNCKTSQRITLDNLTRQGFSCKCYTGSFGERLIKGLLDSNDIFYIAEHKVKIKNHNRYYDFYLPDKNLLIEIHGVQHYQDSHFFNSLSIKQKEIDYLKKQEALNRGYSFLEVDMRESVNDVIEQVGGHLSLKNKNIVSHTNIQKNFNELYQSGTSKKQIESAMNISETLYYRLKSVALTDYNLSLIKQKRHQHIKKGKKVICINTKSVFVSVSQAARYFKTHRPGIANCCKKVPYYNSCGKHPVTGESLKWMYYEDYIEKYGTEGLTEYAEDEIHSETDDLKVSS